MTPNRTKVKRFNFKKKPMDPWLLWLPKIIISFPDLKRRKAVIRKHDMEDIEGKPYILLPQRSDSLLPWFLSVPPPSLLPRGRHPNHGAGHLGSCKGQQEDSLNQWKWERDLPRGQKALHRVEKNGGIWLSAQL